MGQDESAKPADESSSLAGVGVGCLLPVRRSGRVRKRSSQGTDEVDDKQQHPVASPSTTASRQTPKRKATKEVFDLPDDLLEASLAPWKENEKSEWASWVELESDPAFFTAILGLLGVKGARIVELLSADEDSLTALPPPVYGMIFLYHYVGEDDTVPNSNEPSGDVWYANQTTSNACATIALLNIIMNAEGLSLGEKLLAFKEESRNLSPPLRGNMISKSAWIRTAHNAFSRRLDLLDAALALQNQVDKRKRRSGARPRKTTAQEPDEESTYHFIAFVPIGQKVWQLDGLSTGPVFLGEYAQDQHWTSVVGPVIQQKMAQYETELSFNLLALCGDDASHTRQSLATNIRRLEALEARLGSSAQWKPKPNPNIICSPTDARLSVYQVDAEDIQSASVEEEPESSEPGKPLGPTSEAVEKGLAHWEQLSEEQERLRLQYEDEVGGIGSTGVFARTKDHTPAIHAWVKMLAEHGVLHQLHEEVKLHNAS